jgi:outer membrane biosynthesis protein TonB
MFHRTAALTAATLALSALGGTSVALAGGETTTVTVPVPAPAPPPVTVTTPAPPPVTVTAPAPPAPAPAPKPKPKHHHKHGSKGSSAGSNSGNAGSNSGSSNESVSSTEPSPETAVSPRTTGVVDTNETSTVPTGSVQAGGGGTAMAHAAGPAGDIVVALAAVALFLIGSRLALRRRGLNH